MLQRQHDLRLSTACEGVPLDTVFASDERHENPENEIAYAQIVHPWRVHSYTDQIKQERMVALSNTAKDSWQKCRNKQNFRQYTSDQEESEKCMPQLGILKSMSLCLSFHPSFLERQPVSHFPTEHNSEKQKDSLFRV